jgi:phosphatidylserine synthase
MKSPVILLFIGLLIPIALFCVLYFILLSGKIQVLSFNAIAIALGLTTVNFLLGILAVKIGIYKSDKIFITSILGGMTIRLLILLGAVFISLKFLEINHNNFIFTLLFFYIYYLSIEIFYLNFKKK